MCTNEFNYGLLEDVASSADNLHRCLAFADTLDHAPTRVISRAFPCFLPFLVLDAPALSEAGRAFIELADDAGMRTYVLMGTVFDAWAESVQGKGARGSATIARSIRKLTEVGT